MTHVRQAYQTPTLGISTLAPRNRAAGLASEQTNMRSDPVNKLRRRPSMDWLQNLGSIKGDVHLHTYRKDGKDITVLIQGAGQYVLATGGKAILAKTPLALAVNDKSDFTKVSVWEDGVEQIVSGSLETYITSARTVKTVEVDGDVYILNTSKTVKMLDKVEASASTQWITYLNVISALNYGETVEIVLADTLGTKSAVSHTVPDLGISNPNYDAADKARATNQVAKDLADKINALTQPPVEPSKPAVTTIARRYTSYSGAGLHQRFNIDKDKVVRDLMSSWPSSERNQVTTKVGEWYTKYHGETWLDWPSPTPAMNAVTNELWTYVSTVLKGTTSMPSIKAIAKGSSVAVYSVNPIEKNWINLEVSTGQGDRSVVAINTEREDAQGLPLYAMAGSIVKIKPSNTSDKGVYFLKAEPANELTDTSEIQMQEVIWEETRSPWENYELDGTTLPYVLSKDNGVWKVGVGDWVSRRAGDDISCPVPVFVDRTINDINYFQSRLVFVSENDVSMTVTKQTTDWWKQSAVQLLETDPIEIASSAAGADIIKHIIPHNRDMLFVCSNAQFKIDGSTAVTPKTVSLQLTTRYDVDTTAAPVGIGNAVYLPFSYGSTAGIQEYQAEKDTFQDRAEAVTHHIAGLLKGTIRLMTASSNIEMIAVQANGMKPNEIAVFEQFTSGGQIHQRSWSVWELPDDDNVIDMQFRGTTLNLITTDKSHLFRKAIDVTAVVEREDIYLDNRLIGTVKEGEITLPTGYTIRDSIIAVRDRDCPYPLNKAQFTDASTKLVFTDPELEGCTIQIGERFRSSYAPTRPFYMDGNGLVNTYDRVRVNSFTLNLVDSAEVSMSINSDLFSFDDQVDTGKLYDPTESVDTGRHMDNVNNKLGTIPIYTRDVRFSYRQDAAAAEATFFTEGYLNMTVAGISWEGQFYQSARGM